MAEGRLRVIGVAPGGAALRRSLRRAVKDGTLVSAWDDSRLRTVQSALDPEIDAEAIPFGDVLGRFVGMCGLPARRIPSMGVQRAAVEDALAQLEGEGPLAGANRFPGTVLAVTNAVRDLRHAGFDAATLRDLMPRASGRLAPKLDDLATVMAHTAEQLSAANFETASERAERWALPASGGRPPLPRLVIVADDEPHGVYEDWLRRVSAAGVDVTVLAEALPQRKDLFASTHRLAARLGKKLTMSDDPAWTSAMFGDGAVADGPEPTITSAADPLAECEWALRGCLARLSEDVPPHRIAIFARDAATYAPLLEIAAKRLGVPIEMTRRAPLLTNGFARLMLETLRTLGGHDVRPLARLGRSSYLSDRSAPLEGLGPLLGNAYRTRIRQWEEVERWVEAQPETFPWLTVLVRWRHAAVASMTDLGGWIARLRQLGEVEGLLELALASERPTAIADKHAWTRLQASLTEHAMAPNGSGGDLSLAGFAERAGRIWSDETYFAGSSGRGVPVVHQTSRLSEVDTLFALGLLEGTLPRRRAEDPVLEDRDRQELADLAPDRVPLTTSFDQARAERDEFVRLVACATGRLVLSFPETGDDRDNVPAFYLEEIRRAFGDRVRTVEHPRSETVPPLAACVTPADLELREALDGPRQWTSLPELVSDWAQTIVRPNMGQGVSPEELAAVGKCSFRAAATYRLGLRPPRRSTGLNALVSLPAAALLAAQPDPDSARRALRVKVEELLDQTYADLDPWESSLLETAAERLIDQWVDREFRARELWTREGQGFRTQVPLGQEGLRDDPRVAGRQIRLRGTVPAVSMTGEYSVIHLYESTTPDLTAAAEMRPDDDQAFRLGLYLMAQLKRGPAGLAVQLDGLDGTRIMAVLPGGDAPNLKTRPNDGLKVVRIATRQHRGEFFQEVSGRLSTAVQLLEEAKMRPRPGEACEQCGLGELCRVSREFGERLSPFDEPGGAG